MSGGSTDLDFIIENIEEHSPDTSQKENSIVMNNQAVPIEVQKNTGAKKKFYYSESIATNLSSKSFQPNMDHTFLDKKKGEYLPSNFQATVDMINQGMCNKLFFFPLLFNFIGFEMTLIRSFSILLYHVFQV